MIVDKQMTEEAASSMSAQLYRYYDIEGEVQTGYSEYDDNLLRVFYEVDSGVTSSFIKARILENKIEGLYLVGPDNELIEPTTSSEEQEQR